MPSFLTESWFVFSYLSGGAGLLIYLNRNKITGLVKSKKSAEPISNPDEIISKENLVDEENKNEELVVQNKSNDDLMKEEVYNTLEEIRLSIESAVVTDQENKIKFTVSLGVSKQNKEDSIESAVKRADESVYIAKETGRNKIVVHPDDEHNFKIPVIQTNLSEKNNTSESKKNNQARMRKKPSLKKRYCF